MDINRRRSDAYKKSSSAPDRDKRDASTPAGKTGAGFPMVPARDSGAADAGRVENRGEKRAGKTTATGRIAQFLALIGKDAAADVLKRLPAADIEKIVSELVRIRSVGSEEAAQVLTEFGFRAEVTRRGLYGGPETARGLLDAAFGAERADEIFRKAVPDATRFFAFLNEYEPAQIKLLVKGESPAVIAAVISHLEPDVASGVLSLLEPADQAAIVRRIGRATKIDREVLARVEQTLKERIRTQGRIVSEELDGKSTLASILRAMDPTAGDKLLNALRVENEELSDDVRKRMFTVETLLLVDDADLQRVLREFTDRDIALVVKGKTDDLRAKILSNVSERRRIMIADEYHALGAVPRSDVDEVTSRFVSICRDLEERGEIVVRRAGTEYVV